MGWTPLRERINQIPLVLAGPILRRTEPNAVTVWIALKESRTVTLVIFDTNKKVLITGRKKTTQLGVNLHVVAVTAKSSHAALLYGENYLYNLAFDPGETLAQAGVLNLEGSIAEITYPGYELPSFALVPNNLKDLRLIHGSCRKPHGESIDALATVDKMIREALVKDPKKRPHQLFLTGDQIYVDDVADALLFMLMDGSQTLLGWLEILPVVTNPEQLNPGKRNYLATYVAGLTASINKINRISNIAKSHLFTFGEFCVMYLFAWCDVLWPKLEDLPTFADVHPNSSQFARGEAEFKKELKHLQHFRETLKKIRRALANVPTYMIFDDHEITDDWYLNMAWCDRVLSKPLGRRVLQNGLLAYGICQAWGNTPDEFEQGKPGAALLQAAEAWATSHGQNPESEDEITRLIGLPLPANIRNSNPRQVSHSKDSLNWHYTVTGPGYEVLVLDTRTWRAFPGKDFDFPGLLSEEGCDRQISSVIPPKDAEVTLVISPGPVIGVPFLETIQKAAKAFAETIGSAAWGFDPEAWGLEATAFERLLAALALRASPANKGRVIVLSGDVHYGFAARLQYAATNPFQHSHNCNAEMIVVQFTSSSFKNEVSGTGGSHSLHKKGFFPIEAIKHLPTAEILGWNNQEEKELEIGVIDFLADEIFQRLPWRIKSTPAKVDLVQARSWHRLLEITKKPEWWYRIDFLVGKYEQVREPQNSDYVKPQYITAPLPGEERKEYLEQYLAMAKNYRDYHGRRGCGKEIVGLNNLGEITFEVVDGKQVAIQTLWWQLESWDKGTFLEPFPLTRYEVSLEFCDREHPMSDVLKDCFNRT
ncbi:hypothetical protein ACF3DV_01830 [Chlorogloeopsis fritschii PCC 9212]|uniref:PhoD-like phosphatase metallophosphatase domain-containing protein n=1 Tax=Chlorogloeopsis fritschii PCC 6912 TaxID=211165 RepID=A0A433NCL0_CHLFR|nr:hypothetical protein [Chlorogloeopsis fritschii]RUR79703.1 hypothetical protein PCC6912_32390 [Chlorogloeopsis fritschii PCC 6912]